jgi:hypothetical protein
MELKIKPWVMEWEDTVPVSAAGGHAESGMGRARGDGQPTNAGNQRGKKVNVKKIVNGVVVVGLVLVFGAPAMAGGDHDKPKQGAAWGTYAEGGTGVGTGGNASATGIGINTQGQSQSNRQRQNQSQGQNQGQLQNNDQTISPSQSVNFEGTNFDRYAPSIAAPALTSGGIGICLGSFSVGLTGPMAGIAFGKTTQDDGCARARDAMILHNMGHKGAAMRVLSGESMKDALQSEGLLPKSAKKIEAPKPVAEMQAVPQVAASSDFGAKDSASQGN